MRTLYPCECAQKPRRPRLVTKMKLFGCDPKGLYDLDREYQACAYTQMTAMPLQRTAFVRPVPRRNPHPGGIRIHASTTKNRAQYGARFSIHTGGELGIRTPR